MISNKVKSLSENLNSDLNNKKIVFTNGCFDLVHLGHLQYLYEASKYGDKLVVGLNSDKSIAKLKGPGRPINNFEYRSKFLSYLNFIDIIIKFEDETPLELIKVIKPDVLVKGGDYEINKIVGYKEVIAYGGIVTTIDIKYNQSTSKILDKIQNNPLKNQR